MLTNSYLSSGRKQAEENLKYQVKFQTLLLDISRTFNNTESDDIDVLINDT